MRKTLGKYNTSKKLWWKLFKKFQTKSRINNTVKLLWWIFSTKAGKSFQTLPILIVKALQPFVFSKYFPQWKNVMATLLKVFFSKSCVDIVSNYIFFRISSSRCIYLLEKVGKMFCFNALENSMKDLQEMYWGRKEKFSI